MIDTERLLLSPYESGDVPAILALSADPDVRRFIGNLPDPEEGAWTRVLRCAGHWSLFGFGTLAVVERASGRIRGKSVRDSSDGVSIRRSTAFLKPRASFRPKSAGVVSRSRR